MIKMYALLPRRPDVTVEQFHRHWSTVHRELALRIRRLRRYVQAHRTRPDLPGVEPLACEGIPEVWFDSLESALGQREDPAYLAGAKLDEPNFIAVDGIRRMLADPLAPTAPPPAGAAKAILFAARPAGAAPAAFARAWDELLRGPAPAAAGAVAAAGAIARADAPAAGAAPFDAALELWWPDAAALERGWADGGADLLDAVGAVADRTSCHGYRCEELRVIWP